MRWSAPTIDPLCGSILDDGRIDLDTNPVEPAIVASPVETARLDGIEPSVWLRDSLTHMVDGSRLGDLVT
ncbi:MAG: hypothetical protein ACRYGI_19500 [Janthinobacterium lividum]